MDLTVELPKGDQLFIGGRWTPSEGGSPEVVINPATERALAEVISGSTRDVEQALAAARRAFDRGPWPSLDRRRRVEAIQAIHDGIVRRREQILRLVQLECGYTSPEALNQYSQAERHTRRFIEIARNDPMKSLPISVTPNANGAKSLAAGITTRVPIGVVVAITPYNAGFFLAALKAVPALLAGNTVILKPSPFTPLQAFLFAEIAAEADLPAGVFNLLTGGVASGTALTSDPRVDMVTFTGSDSVGAAIMGQAAPTLKKVHLELGGKSALIVRSDADLDLAVSKGLNFAWMCGQGCTHLTRHLVSNDIRAAYVERLGAAVKALKIGDPLDPRVSIGPLIREAARKRSENYVELGLKEGGQLVVGGRRPAGIDRGYFFEPTVFDGVDNDSRIAQEEIFGPIACVIGFDDDDEAVRLANASRFGLGGRIISADVGGAMEMALKVRTGTLMINNASLLVDMPFGGFKRSGLGREWGEEGYNEYTELKAVGFNGA